MPSRSRGTSLHILACGHKGYQFAYQLQTAHKDYVMVCSGVMLRAWPTGSMEGMERLARAMHEAYHGASGKFITKTLLLGSYCRLMHARHVACRNAIWTMCMRPNGGPLAWAPGEGREQQTSTREEVPSACMPSWSQM